MARELLVGSSVLELGYGDIVTQNVEAIVNAANSALAGGGGVDGAIHRAGGAQIMAECREIGGCPPGEAVVTTGGNLQARFVIHTVGPIYRAGDGEQERVLASAYRNSLKRAVENGVRSVAFPSISTGAYGYPMREAAQIALKATMAFLGSQEHALSLVKFVLFDEKALRTYEAELERIASE